MGGEQVDIYSLPSFDAGKRPERVRPDEVGSAKTRLTHPVVLVGKLNPHIPRVWCLREVTGESYCSPEFFALQPAPDILDIGYLYYFLQSKMASLAGSVKGSTNSHKRLGRDDFMDLRIPVPSMAAQREIAQALDAFSGLVVELKDELTARRDQYDHYSRQLLSPAHVDRRLSLGDATSLIIDHRGKTPKKLGGDWTPSGHRVVSALNMKNSVVDGNDHHYISAEMYKKWMTNPLKGGDVLLTSEAPLGAVAYVWNDVDWAIGQRMFALRPRPEFLDGRYLYHLLRSGPPREDLLGRSTGSTVSGIRQSELVKVSVALPSLSEQASIAAMLDRFERLILSAEEGLPGEIVTRQEQYEYYRDQLFSFEEAAA